MTKHSPAPFRAHVGDRHIILIDAFGDSICSMARQTGDHPAEEQAANCRLFVASPDLLAAAIDLESTMAKLVRAGLLDIAGDDVSATAVAERLTALKTAIDAATAEES